MKMIHPQSELFQGISAADYVEFQDVSVADLSLLSGEKITTKKTFITSDRLEPAQVVSTLISSGVGSLLQKNPKSFGGDLKTTAGVVGRPQEYFNKPGAFLAEANAAFCEIRFASPAEKPELKRQAAEFLQGIQSQNVQESAEAIIEELYMNSMLDAPREAAKKGQTNCSYEVGLTSTLRLHLGGQKLIISCEDPFGSLDMKKFVARMNEVYEKGAGESINFREGGAGLGCVIMFEHCEALFLGVIPGEKTLVTCVVPVGMSYRQRAQLKKSLHLVSLSKDN